MHITDGMLWMNGTTSVPKSVLRYTERSSGLYHRHLVHGMDVTILTSLIETNFHCYLSMEYLGTGDIDVDQ